MSFSGMPIITSPYLTEDEEREVSRTWPERLWSWPWRPWVATKRITVQVPSTQVFVIDGKYVMHPAALTALMEKTPIAGRQP